MPLFALAQSASAPPAAGAGELDRSSDIVTLVAGATVVGKIVLLILLIFSAISWAVIFYKIWVFRRSEQQSATFLGVFRKSAKFSKVQAVCPTLAASPLVGLFQSGYAELNTQLADRPDRGRQAGSGRGASNAEESRCRRPCAAAGDDRRTEQAGEPRPFSGDHGQHHALHRSVRNGVGHRDCVPGDRGRRAIPVSASSRSPSQRR